MSEIHSAGSCLCGAVRYRIDGKVRSTGICTCRQCQRQTGAPLAAFVTVAAADLTVSGDVAGYRASDFATRSFCPRCGSTLFWRRDGAEDVDIFIGSIDDLPAVPAPAHHLWAENHLAWLPKAPGVPVYPQDRPSKG